METEREQIQRLLQEMKLKIREDHFSKGLPIVYMDEEGWMVEEWKDGRIVKLKKIHNGATRN